MLGISRVCFIKSGYQEAEPTDSSGVSILLAVKQSERLFRLKQTELVNHEGVVTIRH